MGAGNWSAQDQTLRLSWVRLLDYFFTPKTASAEIQTAAPGRVTS